VKKPTNPVILSADVMSLWLTTGHENGLPGASQERREGRGFRVCVKTPPACHSERSEESCSEYFQRSARFLVAFSSSE